MLVRRHTFGGGGGMPQDRSPERAQIEADAAAREAEAKRAYEQQQMERQRQEAEAERQRQEAEQAQKDADFNALLEAAYVGGVNSALTQIGSYGVDPELYRGKVTDEANRLKATVPKYDENPASYFDSLAERLINNETIASRSAAARSLDQIAPTGFASRRIDPTADDASINAILAEQRAEADQYLDNLITRGIITDIGGTKARSELDRQGKVGSALLQELGGGVLETGRQGARDIANKARDTAGALQFGQSYDPSTVRTDLDSYFTNFFKDLPGKLRVLAPTDLFTTSTLGAIAGKASGAQNTAFDPKALAGLVSDDEEEDKNKNKATTAMF